MAKAKTGRPKPDAVAPASKPAPSAGMAGSPAARPAPSGAGRYTLWALARTAPARHAETGLGGGRGMWHALRRWAGAGGVGRRRPAGRGVGPQPGPGAGARRASAA